MLDVTARSGSADHHLIVSPEGPTHIDAIRRVLTRLRFTAHNDDHRNLRPDGILANYNYSKLILLSRAAGTPE
jgi:hypothetical protein